MVKGINTDPQGFILPSGEKYKWDDVTVDIEIIATVTLPDGKTVVTINGALEDSAEILVELLNKTCFPLDS
jgi:hypothetical protein